MATTVGSVALDIIMGRNTVSGTIRDAMGDVARIVSDTSATASQKIDAIGNACTKAGTAMTTVSTALYGVGVTGVMAAGEMDEAVNQFLGTTGKSIAELERYEDVLKDIHSANYGEDYMDIADAMAVVNQQLGEMSDADLKKTTESAIALRDTFGYDVSESIRSADTLMKNFGVTSDEAFNLIVQGAQNGLDFSGELLDSINEYSVQFGKAGLDAEAMFSIFQSGADAGAWNLDKIGDAVKEFSIRVIDGSDATAEGLEAIGLSASKMSKKFAEGGDSANEVFNLVIQKLGEMEDPLAQNTAGVALFGTMWEDLGPQVVTQLSTISDSVDATKQSMEELKEVRYNNVLSQLETLKRSVTDNILVPVGEILIPILSDLVDAVTPVIEAFGDMDPEMQKTIVGVLGFVAAAGPVLIVVGKIIGLVSSAAGVISTLSGLFTGAGAAAGAAAGGATAAGGAIAALGGPVTIVIGIVAGLVAIGVALYKNWDTVKEKAGQLKDWTVEKFGELKTGVTDAFENLKTGVSEKVTQIGDFIGEHFGGTISGAKDLFSSFKDFTGDVFEGTKTAALGPIATMCQVIAGDLDGAKETAVDTLTRLKENGGEIMQSFADVVGYGVSLASTWVEEKTAFASEIGQKAFKTMAKGIGDTVSDIAEAVEDGFNEAVDFITSLPGRAYEWGSDIIENIVDGIRGAIKNVQSAASDVAQTIREYLHFTVPDKGPLADFNTYMPDMMSQLAGGMLAGIPDVRKAVGEVAGVMSGGLALQAEAPALRNVKTYSQQNSGSVQTQESRLETMLAAILKWLEEHDPTGTGEFGDIVVPVYVNGNMDEVNVYKAQELRNQRSGGRA